MEDIFDFEDLIRRVEADDSQVLQDSLKNEEKCQECGGELIERDGLYYCNICQIQAQDVKFTVEAECNYDEDGNLVHTQKIVQEKTDPHSLVDFGSIWTTSEAYSLILRRQVELLEHNRLVSLKYCRQVQELWFSYFKKFLLNAEMLRERDQSIMKGCTKVDIPPLLKRIVNDRPSRYRFGNHDLYKHKVSDKFNQQSTKSEIETSKSPTNLVEVDNANDDYRDTDSETSEIDPMVTPNTACEDPNINVSIFDPITELFIDEEQSKMEDKRRLNSDNIEIMTLGKTLGFLEAIARLRCTLIFASDLARWSDQGVLPYHDCVSYFPADWKLNHKDRVTFSQRVSPKPTNISSMASNLLNVLCHSFELPLPDPRVILRRMLMDMNMPCTDSGLLDLVLETVTFDDLKMKLSVKLGSNKKRVQSLPQFDRWAVAMIIITLKKHFIFDGLYEDSISSLANNYNKENLTNTFVFKDWFEQSYTRLRLIEQYDVGHYNQDLEKMESSTFCHFFGGEASKWLTTATTRKPGTCRSKNDVNRQRDLKHFLLSAIPLPVDKGTNHIWEKPNPSFTPLTDAYNRVRDVARKIIPQVNLEKNFMRTTMNFYIDHEKNNDFCTLRDKRQWSFGTHRKGIPVKTTEDWPITFKHLLDISGFLCYCDPQEILRELQSVERIVALKTVTRNERRKVKIVPVRKNV